MTLYTCDRNGSPCHCTSQALSGIQPNCKAYCKRAVNVSIKAVDTSQLSNQDQVNAALGKYWRWPAQPVKVHPQSTPEPSIDPRVDPRITRRERFVCAMMHGGHGVDQAISYGFDAAEFFEEELKKRGIE